MSDLQAQIQAELEQARAICQEKGIHSPECAVAYDTVEELQAEAAHQRQAQPRKPPLSSTVTPTRMPPSAGSTTTKSQPWGRRCG